MQIAVTERETPSTGRVHAFVTTFPLGLSHDTCTTSAGAPVTTTEAAVALLVIAPNRCALTETHLDGSPRRYLLRSKPIEEHTKSKLHAAIFLGHKGLFAYARMVVW